MFIFFYTSVGSSTCKESEKRIDRKDRIMKDVWSEIKEFEISDFLSPPWFVNILKRARY